MALKVNIPPVNLDWKYRMSNCELIKTENDIVEFLSEAIQLIVKIPRKLRPSIRLLADIGWFPSGEMGMSEIYAFQQTFDSGNKDAVDQSMINWLQSEMPEIRKRLTKRFPHRRQILEAAFTAHECAQYELSIPVLLAQTEGMCLEVLGTKLFSTDQGMPVTRKVTEKLLLWELSEVFLLPIREPHGLTASKRNRGIWPEALNRHEILHGISTDYATLVNSYKAISLIEYFYTFVVRRFDTHVKVKKL